MKKPIIYLSIFLLIVSLTYAQGLDEYPDFLLEDNEPSVVIVVGDQAPATHVLAQSKIVLALGSYFERPLTNTNKLASEIEDIDDLNIISIGNACDNEVSSEILSNPEPCDENLQKNKAVIELFESSEDKVHIVLSSDSEAGIKQAAEVLANFANFELTGTKYEIDIESEDQEQEEEIEGKDIDARCTVAQICEGVR